MTTERIWFVFDMNKREDSTKPRIGDNVAANMGIEAPRRDNGLRRAPARRAVPEPDDEFAVQEDQVPNGYGYTILRDDRKDMELCFTSEQAAVAYAKEQAEKKPKTLFGVFSCVRMFETTTPTIIEKQFTADGELIVSK